MYFRMIKANCVAMSYIVEENGLMDLTVPMDCEKSDICEFLNNLGQDNLDEIVDKQKKNKEKFRIKLHKQIRKYADDFNIPFYISLQLRAQTKKLNDSHVDLYGISFNGKMQLVSVLQYFPEDIVNKIVRYTVLGVAIDYEKLCRQIIGIRIGGFQYPDVDSAEEEYHNKPDEANYKITMSDDEIKRIQADYDDAVKRFKDAMKKSPILSL